MKQPDPSNFDQLKEYVIDLFPAQLAPLVVPKEQQDKALQAIHETIGGQRFYFLVDMPTFSITRSAGIQTWLGYPEQEFSLKQYWNIVHPGNQIAAHAVFLQMANRLCTGQLDIQFMVQRYSSLTTLKHFQTGRYLLCKRTASVFQYDQQKRLVEYLNEFTVIGQYKGEPLSPLFFTNTGLPEKERGKPILDAVKDNFPGMKVFSKRELELAILLADHPGISQQEMADQWKVTVDNIKTLSQRFMKKARDHFYADFATCDEAARYLRDGGLI